VNTSRIVFYSIAPLVVWALAGVTAPMWMPQARAHSMTAIAAAQAVDAVAVPVAETPHPQTKCPIRGGAINKNLYADVEGYRIYVCCPGCLDKVRADPKAAVDKIRANGEEPEKAPAEKS